MEQDNIIIRIMECGVLATKRQALHLPDSGFS